MSKCAARENWAISQHRVCVDKLLSMTTKDDNNNQDSNSIYIRMRIIVSISEIFILRWMVAMSDKVC